MKREELLRSQEYWVTQMQVALFEAINSYLKENRLTKTQFAAQIGVNKSYITQVLNGDFDHKMSKFVQLLLSCGKVPVIDMVSIEDYISGDTFGGKGVESASSNPDATRVVRVPATNKESRSAKPDSKAPKIPLSSFNIVAAGRDKTDQAAPKQAGSKASNARAKRVKKSK